MTPPSLCPAAPCRAVPRPQRLMPPAPITSREALRDISVAGWRIPAGAMVHLDLAAILKDPRYWGPDPEAFRPERFLPVRCARAAVVLGFRV